MKKNLRKILIVVIGKILIKYDTIKLFKNKSSTYLKCENNNKIPTPFQNVKTNQLNLPTILLFVL